MRKIIMLAGIIVVAAIAIAWSTRDGRNTSKSAAEATMQPHDIMLTIGRHLPAEYWADPF
jgi:hypothetical protein